MDDVIERDAPAGTVSDDEQPDQKQPKGTADKPEGKQPKGSKSETVTLTRAEHEALKRDRDEARDSEKYWAGLARANGKAPAKEEPEDEEEEDTPDDPANEVEEFSAKGIAALKKRGVITKKDRAWVEKIATKVVKQSIGVERQKMTLDQTLAREFPELVDPDESSEFYQTTRTELRKLVALDPAAAKSASALYSAAKLARAQLDAKKPARRARDDSRDDDEDEREDDRDEREDDREEDERDRRRRVAAQGGGRGRTAARERDDDDGLPPMARKLLEGMHSDTNEAERVRLFREGQQIIRNGGTPKSRLK